MSVAEPAAGTRESAPAARALWSALDAAANPLSLLVMLASLVRTLGAADYGVLAIALAASGITMAVNPAIAITTTKFVSELAGQIGSRRQTVAGVVTASLTAVMLIDLVLIGGTVLWREPLSNWVFGESIHFHGKDTVLLLAMVAVGVQQIDAVMGAAIRGLEHFRRQALIELGMRGALTAVVTAVAWRTGSVAAILVAQCVVYAVFMLLRVLALRALLPERRLLVSSSRHQVLSLLRYGGWMWLSAIAGVAYTSGDRIIVGRVLGAAAAGEYSIYVQLTQIIHFVPSNLFAFSLPAFSRLSAGGIAHAEIGRAYRGYFLAICASALGLTLALMACWPYVLRIFAAANVPAGGPSSAVLLLAGNFLLLSATVVPYYLLLALGKSRVVSLTTSSWMCVSLLLMIVLIPRYGLVGAAAARLAYVLGAVSFIARAHRLLKSP
jgi:O-antigen/teichoic acid export membrane protein